MAANYSSTLFTANLPMQLLGQNARLAVERATGSDTRLVAVPDDNFDWKRIHRLAGPQVITGRF